MLNSLFSRLLLASLLLLSVFFSMIYFAINQTYLTNTISSKKDQLLLQNYVLLSAASIENDTILMPDELREPRFEEYKSGLYGFIYDQQGNILWTSYSAHDLKIDLQKLIKHNPTPGNREFQQTENYYISHHYVEWELIDDQSLILTFSVLEDTTLTIEKVQEFQFSILRLLTISGLALVVALLTILRWGTLPLKKLAANIKSIENGTSSRLEGTYPMELNDVGRNLNELIDTEQQQRERYHNTLADLAHSLKTPLAVIKVELETKPGQLSDAVITEQSLRMEEIITHQLQRAVISSPNTLTDKVSIGECVQKISSALGKVYADKAVSITQDVSTDISVRGDKRDLMEILGNVADNACKACLSTVKISAYSSNNKLHIEIHDDGKGISEELRKAVLERGQRLDTKTSGQGIGLDVVQDIIKSYKGELLIGMSPLGGALFTIILPS
jgi:two-component system sensor histidine kinase PhoQ